MSRRQRWAGWQDTGWGWHGWQDRQDWQDREAEKAPKRHNQRLRHTKRSKLIKNWMRVAAHQWRLLAAEFHQHNEELDVVGFARVVCTYHTYIAANSLSSAPRMTEAEFVQARLAVLTHVLRWQHESNSFHTPYLLYRSHLHDFLNQDIELLPATTPDAPKFKAADDGEGDEGDDGHNDEPDGAAASSSIMPPPAELQPPGPEEVVAGTAAASHTAEPAPAPEVAPEKPATSATAGSAEPPAAQSVAPQPPEPQMPLVVLVDGQREFGEGTYYVRNPTTSRWVGVFIYLADTTGTSLLLGPKGREDSLPPFLQSLLDAGWTLLEVTSGADPTTRKKKKAFTMAPLHWVDALCLQTDWQVRGCLAKGVIIGGFSRGATWALSLFIRHHMKAFLACVLIGWYKSALVDATSAVLSPNKPLYIVSSAVDGCCPWALCRDTLVTMAEVSPASTLRLLPATTHEDLYHVLRGTKEALLDETRMLHTWLQTLQQIRVQ